MQKNLPLRFLISGFLVLMFASGCKTAPPNVALGYSYPVQTGDTLEAVAEAYQKQGVDVTVEQIMAENPGIKITTNTEAGAQTFIPETGQRIFIPDKNVAGPIARVWRSSAALSAASCGAVAARHLVSQAVE